MSSINSRLVIMVIAALIVGVLVGLWTWNPIISAIAGLIAAVIVRQFLGGDSK
jgi:membrane protein implicated in regulation of membrane protease activity